MLGSRLCDRRRYIDPHNTLGSISMAYTLQAIVARSGTLPEPLLDQLKLVHLFGGVDLIPLGPVALKAYALPFLPLTDEGQ